MIKTYCSPRWRLQPLLRQLWQIEPRALPRTTEHDARPLVEPREREVQNIATDVVEENVKVPDCLLEVVVERRALIVERFIDPEVLLEPLTLVVGSGNCDDFGTQLLPDLTYDRSCCTRGARDDQCLASLDLANVKEAL